MTVMMDKDVGLPDSVSGYARGGWTQPGSTTKESEGLLVHNSLSFKKVPFVTRDGSHHVTWYICGPTVYDSSHVGHARNYVTFDIIRRILEEYFGYEVFYVMNVTDVDDKIIRRARLNHLLDEYYKSAVHATKVAKDLEAAFQEEIQKQQKQVLDKQEELANTSSARQRDELTEKVKQEQLKLDKLKEARLVTEESVTTAVSLGGKEGVDLLLAGAASDILASYLDEKGRGTVTDHAIYRAHAAKYEQEFLEDMASLGVRPPDVLTRVTEYIDKIINYVQVILDRKLAYVANGSVYFDTKAFRDAGHEYGKLNPWAVGSSGLASESESNFETTEKKNSCDFALWKKSKEGEPEWESPWGMGRPGWHIECSAMASDIIGASIDIHSGGHDLQFPHHDNELAQAEAYFNCSQWVNYFFHSGHLSIDGLKMSKSLKNFITIKEALKKYTARQLRFLFVIQSWNKSINFSETVVNEAVGKEKQLKQFFSSVQVVLRQAALEDKQRWEDDEKHLQHRLQAAQTEVRMRLEDNFDTAGAMSKLLSLVKDVHSYLAKCDSTSSRPKLFLVRKAAVFVTSILSVFGLSDAGKGEIGFGSTMSQSGPSASLESVVGPYLDAFAAFRDQIRTAAKEGAPRERILEIADRVRDETMADLGVRFEDKGSSSTWKLDDPEVLRKERDEKLHKAREEMLRSLKQNRDSKAKQLDKFEAASVPPREYFQRRTSEYSSFDDRGVPTHDSDGKELTKNAKKKVEKDFKKAEDEHEKCMQKVVAEPGFLHSLRSEVELLESKIAELEQAQ